MAHMTIAQLREKEVEKLATFRNGEPWQHEPTEEEKQQARRMMNSFYRLCGIDERLLYLENDEKWHDRPYTKNLSAKRDKWFSRLNEQFKEKYGLVLYYSGYCPSIGVRYMPGGGCAEKITRWFYN